jgi:RNA polymerase sigma factor (TIGR02999 family)
VQQEQSFDDLFSLVYEELRRLASQVRRNDDYATVSSTGLVHEAWMKLRGSPDLAFKSAEHFKAIAAKAMRQILVDAARRRHAGKRGGPGEVLIPYNDMMDHAKGSDEELLALDLALYALEQLSPQQGLIVQYHFFGGLTISETAIVLETSESTVERDWRAAKAWLKVQIK